MKWLSLALLLALFVTVGCSEPGGQVGDQNDPAKTSDTQPLDTAAEKAAAGVAQ